jgi:hypothetical protein
VLFSSKNSSRFVILKCLTCFLHRSVTNAMGVNFFSSVVYHVKVMYRTTYFLRYRKCLASNEVPTDLNRFRFQTGLCLILVFPCVYQTTCQNMAAFWDMAPCSPV